MAADDIAAMMLGLEERLATITGLRVSDVKEDQVNPPQAVVGVPPIPVYHMTSRMGFVSYDFTVTLFLSATMTRQAQRLLAEYANPSGDKSIRAAIEADKTLGGRARECVVESFRPLGLTEVGILNYYGGLWSVSVVGRGA